MPEKYSEEWYHNKGEIDRSNGVYDSPSYNTLQVLTSSKEDVEKNIRNTEAYNQGQNNARKMEKRGNLVFF